MNLELRNKLKAMLGDVQETEDFLMIFDSPDEIFDKAYPTLKETLSTIFSTPTAQQDILKRLQSGPEVPADQMKDFTEQLNNEIKQDETLSKNKKELLCDLFTRSTNSVLEMQDNPREKISVKVVRTTSDAILPTYAHPSDTGADIYSSETVTIPPHSTVLVPTGLKVAIPVGYEISIRPRSGLSLKTNLRIANAPGSIDSSYRGLIGIIMTNIGDTPETIEKGDRIAQMVIAPSPMIMWDEVETLDETERASGGFGSTGKS